MTESRDNAEKIRNREKKTITTDSLPEMPLALGIKEMPAYDPDMELKGLTFTIPTWITALRRVEKKTEQATEPAKEQLSRNLKQLKTQIDDILGEIGHG